MNNTHTVFGIDTGRINWFPASGTEEIIQNVGILLTTVIGSVTLNRRLGLNAGFIDEPSPRAMMNLSIFALETIQEYEPRVQVLSVDFVPDPEAALNGKLYPKVEVRI